MKTIACFTRALIAIAVSLPLLTGGTNVRAAEGEGFASCLARLRPEAMAKGVSAATFDAQTAVLTPDMAVIGFLDAQPEFVTPIWDYLAALVDDERVGDGRQMLTRWGEVLTRVENAYGVDPATVVAVWGVES